MNKNNLTNKEISDFMYKAFFREKNPSIFRLAVLQLSLEGERFDPKNYDKVFLKILDRADVIVKKIRRSKTLKDMHRVVIESS